MAFLLISIIFAFAHWYFVYKENRMGIVITKPAVMIFLMIWMLVSIPEISSPVTTINILPVWFLLGLFFGLMGDIFLIWPERLFLPGLLSFLINQVFYLIGFGTYYAAHGNQFLQMGIYILIFAAFLTVVYYLFRGMDVNGSERMKIPVGIYALIITLMLIAAIETFFFQWPVQASVFVSLGALSFFVSDIMNAWTRFVGPISEGRLKIMSTYHTAQILITIGIVLAATLSV